MAAPLTVVIGASGQVGRFVLPRLVAAGHRVAALSRHGVPPGYPELAGVTWWSPRELADVAGVTALVSAGPLELASSLVEQWPDLGRVVAISTTSTMTKADSPAAAERVQIARIMAAEGALGDLLTGREVPLVVLRPTLVWGAGLDHNLTRLARWVRRWGVVPVAGSARGLRQPLHADDLAQVAVRALTRDPPLALDTPVCGGTTLPYRDMVAAVFTALGRDPRIVSLPPPALEWAAALAGRFTATPTSAAMAARQQRDLVFDDSPAREHLGHEPGPFAPIAADFEPPISERILEIAASGVGNT